MCFYFFILVSIYLAYSSNATNIPSYGQEDPEQGLSGGLTTEEAIHILVKSYKSSAISHQVQTEVVKIRKRVSVRLTLIL